MIKKVTDLNNTATKLRVLIAGYPGVGKSTCALSAPKPLLVDTDRGIMRVSAKHRTDGIIQPESYEELIEDLTKNDLSDYETIIFDTGMSLFSLMKYHLIKMDVKNGNRNGSLSQQGYGAIGREFQSLMDLAYYKLNKNVVVIFHSKEEKDGDNTKLRIMIEGQTKDLIWQYMDVGGFIEMENKDRVIQFQNCERFFAKRTYGIKEKYIINDLNSGGENKFLTNLFGEVQANIKKEQMELQEQRDRYNEIMEKYDFDDPAVDINTLFEMISKEENVLTSIIELKAKLQKKAKDGGYKYDKQLQKFILNDAKSA